LLRKAIASATLTLARAGCGRAKAALGKPYKVRLALTMTAADATGHKPSKTTKVSLL
jgi:hypothetical protein